MIDWLLNGQFWLAAGLFLVLSDIFLGFNLFVLPVGVAALIVACIIMLQENGMLGAATFYDDWQDVIYWFAGLSVISVVLLRIVFQRVKSKSPDINDY